MKAISGTIDPGCRRVHGVVNDMAPPAGADTSQAMDDGERRRWRTRWGATVWQLGLADGGWLDLHAEQVAPGQERFAISAWNPGSLALPDAVNRARDELLGAELRARGLLPRRMRGGDPQAGWWEEGWLVGHEPARDAALLRRYGQVAGLILAGGSAWLLWCDGIREPH
jgi:hypothetical protein